MIINITILEDNESDFITLSDSIKKWAANTGILINIIWLNSYKKFIKSLPTLKCDLFFSDIELNCNNSFTGIDACKQLRESGYTGIIIFLTAFKEYVFDGYDVQAFNYLLKPINYGTINNCLDKFIHLFSRKFYYYHKGNDIISIPYNDIMYIEKNGHDVIFHTTSNVFVERTSLNEISKRLPVFFIRAHKSYIVNINKVLSLRINELFLPNNVTIPVSRSYLTNIKKKLLEIAR